MVISVFGTAIFWVSGVRGWRNIYFLLKKLEFALEEVKLAEKAGGGVQV